MRRVLEKLKNERSAAQAKVQTALQQTPSQDNRTVSHIAEAQAFRQKQVENRQATFRYEFAVEKYNQVLCIIRAVEKGV
jgi:hypothetical protein